MIRERLIPREVASLLIDLPSWVGDAVMATPVLRAARQACPAARITGLMRPGIDQVLAGCPYLDDIIVVDSRGARGVLAAAKGVRKIRPEAGLLLPNSFRAALTLRLARVPIRAGYARDGRGWLLTAPVPCERTKQPVAAVDYYARLGEAVFGCATEDRAALLVITDEEREAADRLLADVPARYILINPGANRPDKRWPVERFAEAARRLRHEWSAALVVSGSPAEKALVNGLCCLCGEDAVNLVERGVTLAMLKAVVQRALLLITNDTGPRHLAAAFGTPSIVLFGPTDHRWTTLPYGRERLILAEPFLPEERLADAAPALCAIERIPVSDVVRAAHDLLAGQSD